MPTSNESGADLSAQPKRILLIKGHSAGVGDLLRSSAAWRALKTRFPKAELHLWFLTADSGAASEELIRRHHLLSGFHVSNKRALGWRALISEGLSIAKLVQPDCIIDFEPNGLRTSLLTFILGRRNNADTWGIAQVPLRGLFYRHASPSSKSYAIQHHLEHPLEYTERDFVALAGQQIERFGTQIELRETLEGRAFREQLQSRPGFEAGRVVVGINIGCGTPGALPRRPNLELVTRVVNGLREQYGASILLTGAPYEADVNQALVAKLPPGPPVLDLAGQTNMLQLTGVISACRLFVSGDSGPYHMGVALKVPTLAIFNFSHRYANHHNAWTRCVLAPEASQAVEVLRAADELLGVPKTA